MKTLLKEQMDEGQSTSTMEFKNLDQYDLESLPDALCRFFMVVQRNDGKIYNASSINAYYRALARVLKNRETNPVDISQDIRFSKVTAVMKSRCTQAAKDGQRPGINASHCLSDEDIKTVFETGSLTRENPRGLVSLVHYLAMTSFGCRAQDECRNITNEDLIFGPKSKQLPEYPEWIALSERLTKTRRGGKSDIRDIEGRCYLDIDSPSTCPIRTILMYQARKTPVQLHKDAPFFLCVKASADKDPSSEQFWYKNAPMGVNQLSKLFKDACSKAGLD